MVFRVRILDTKSNEFDETVGIPQGSVLSVTLFLVAINEIIKDLPLDVSKSYVDDLVVYYSASNVIHIERKLHVCVNKIHSWAAGNGYKISVERIVAVHFHRRRRMQYELNLNLNNNRITFKTSAKFLGMILEQRLRWREHIEYMKKPIKRSILKYLSSKTWGGR